MIHPEPSWTWGPHDEPTVPPLRCVVCGAPECEGDADGPGCVPRLATVVRPGESVYDALPLTAAQGAMTLGDYVVARCDVCGVQGVKTYERGPRRVCALCDGRTER